MKKKVQITTEVLEVRGHEVKVRTVLIVLRENGPRSRHEEVRWVRHFGDWVATTEWVHNRLTISVQEWLKTGAKGPELVEYGLE